MLLTKEFYLNEKYYKWVSLFSFIYRGKIEKITTKKDPENKLSYEKLKFALVTRI